jgi:hypothetical protein
MIAPLELVKGMELTPQACVLCGNNPIDENTGEQQDAVFAPGVDVDWGSSVYICKSCGELIADLFGRVTKEGFDRLTTKYEKLKGEHEKLQDQHERAKALLDRIRDGRAAVRENKAQTKREKVK